MQGQNRINSLMSFIFIASFALMGVGCGGSSKEDAPADGGISDTDAGIIIDSDSGTADDDSGMPDSDSGIIESDSGMPDGGPEECRADGTPGILIDTRDNNREYKTTMINCREWMAENAQYQGPGMTCFTNTEADADFLNKFGCTYSWGDAQKVCPEGWHLPTSDEFSALLEYVNEHRTGESLFSALAADSEEWQIEEDMKTPITDEFGFGALPVGACGVDSSGCGLFGHLTGFWASTGDHSFGHLLEVAPEKVSIEGYPLTEAFSVRCLRDEAE